MKHYSFILWDYDSYDDKEMKRMVFDVAHSSLLEPI